MSHIVVCQQPNYFPWLGYLEQCAVADTLIFLDTVQWIRQGRQHRARILPKAETSSLGDSNSSPDLAWLTLPVQGHGHREKRLAEMKLADDGGKWARQHWGKLRDTYARRPYFKTQLEPLVRPWLESSAISGSSSLSLCEIAAGSVRLCLEAFGFSPKIVWSSGLAEKGRATERLVSLCRAAGATTYYTGIGSTNYIDTSLFRDAGLGLVWQRWKHPEYLQGREKKQTHLSVLDALANVPIPEIRDWLAIKPWGPFGSLTLAYLDGN